MQSLQMPPSGAHACMAEAVLDAAPMSSSAANQ
jgi:hypothetical protein